MIKAEALTRKYGDVVAVDDVSFAIGPREIVGLLGHNGAGKTTIMKMVTGYLEPSSGTVTVNGLDAYRDRQLVQELIGYLPENCPLYPELTCLEYLDYAAALRGVPVERRMDRIGYAIEKTKLATVAEKPINTLSRGYRQRLGVAQAILNSPTILILDEPTNGLDPSQILEMRSLVRELAQSATVVISTHILQEVQAVCGRVIIINNGKVALDSEIRRLQATGRLLVTTDGEPELCSRIFAEAGGLKLIEHQQRDRQHCYILEVAGEVARDAAGDAAEEASGRDWSEFAPALARALVEHNCKIYSIQPIIRDLEAIFGEIASARSSEQNGDGGDGHNQAMAVNATNSVTVAAPTMNASAEVDSRQDGNEHDAHKRDSAALSDAAWPGDAPDGDAKANEAGYGS